MVVLGGIFYGRSLPFFNFPSAALGLPSLYPERYGNNLAVVYLIWISIVTALYFPCRWYMNYKNRSHAAWLSYL